MFAQLLFRGPGLLATFDFSTLAQVGGILLSLLAVGGILAWLTLRFIPNNAVFMAVGNVNREALIAQLNNYFGKWTQGTAVAGNFRRHFSEMRRRSENLGGDFPAKRYQSENPRKFMGYFAGISGAHTLY